MNEQFVRAVRRLMLGVAPRLSRIEAQALRELPTVLTHRQYRILFQISQGRDSVSAIRVVAGGTSLATLSESVETLYQRGLVDRSLDESDRRRSVLKLTGAGEQALREAEAAITKTVAVIAHSMELSSSDAEGFCAGVDALSGAVRELLVDVTVNNAP